jgi:recombination DNA repair RAD52 pathway protein
VSQIHTPLDLYKVLFEPFPDAVKSQQSMGGKGKITFVEWYHYISRAWREFPEGFSTEIRNVYAVGNSNPETAQLIMVVRVTDAATGLHQEGSGSAPLTKPKKNYGGCNAEAEAQALKRAFAKFGLGLEMYMDEEDKAQADPDAEPITEPTIEQIQRMKQLVQLCQEAEDNERLVDLIALERKAVSEVNDKKWRIGMAIELLEDAMKKEGIGVPDPS